jgi:hypothetical protein
MKGVAVHEAAHAVVAVAAGIYVGETRINPDGGGSAHFKAPHDLIEFSPHEVVVATLAGQIAQRRVHPTTPPACWQDDDEYISAVLHCRFDCRTEAAVSEMRARFETSARAQVTMHWRWIERVADALLLRKRLNHNEIVRLRPGGNH